MASEIERKFLVVDNQWETLPHSGVSYLIQGYLPQDHRRMTDLSVIFNRLSDDEAWVNLFNKNGYARFVIEGDSVADIQQLSAWSPHGGKITLSGAIEARIRLIDGGDDTGAILAIKHYGPHLQDRVECQGKILLSIEDAKKILDDFCENIVAKKRVLIPYGGHTWEVDVYQGAAHGLITADVEVADASMFDTLQKLPGTGDDVTDVYALRNPVIASGGVPKQYRLHL